MTTRTASLPYPTDYTPTCILAQGSHSALAELLNAEMAANWGARHLYLVTYGVAWSPLPTPGWQAAEMTRSTATVQCPVVSDSEAIECLRMPRTSI